MKARWTVHFAKHENSLNYMSAEACRAKRRINHQPEPGRDVTATLVGSLLVSAQSVGMDVLPEVVPSSRRFTFGWMAQLPEAQ